MKLLWISRHRMSEDQYNALVNKFGEVIVTQVSATIMNVKAKIKCEGIDKAPGYESDIILTGTQPCLAELVKSYDEVAAISSLGILEHILPLVNNRILSAKMSRSIDNNGKSTIKFIKWKVIRQIKIVTEDL